MSLGGSVALTEDFTGGDVGVIDLGIPVGEGLVVPLSVGVGDGEIEEKIRGEESGEQDFFEHFGG